MIDTLSTHSVPLALELAPASPPPAGRAPAAAYLAHLTTAAGRRSMRAAVEMAAQALSGGRCTAETLPWPALRAEHVGALRALLLEVTSARTGRRYKPGMVNKVLAAVRGVAEHCWLMGQIDGESFARIRKVSGVKHHTLPPGRDVSRDEMVKLIASTQNGTPIGVRDAALIALFFGAAPRRGELSSLEVQHYDVATGGLKILDGKGHKDRTTYLIPDCRAAVTAWLELRGPAPGPLLCPVARGGRVRIARIGEESLYQRVGQHVKAAGLPRLSPHDFRRTLIGNMLDAGVDLVTVSQMVGHEDPATTAKYDRRGERSKQRAAGLVRVPGMPGATDDDATAVCPHCNGSGRVKVLKPTP
jgi:integrase